VTASILVNAAHAVELENAPIPKHDILSGTPEARSKMLATSHDGTAQIMAWECTAGEFLWHYSEDETVVVLSGEAFVTNAHGEEYRLADGYVAFFPGGSSSRWRITRPVRKIAVLRKDLPRLAGFAVRVWHLLLRSCGLRGAGARSGRASDRPISEIVREAHSLEAIGSNAPGRR
jgi:uncharacterized cupin superfamily protein